MVNKLHSIRGLLSSAGAWLPDLIYVLTYTLPYVFLSVTVSLICCGFTSLWILTLLASSFALIIFFFFLVLFCVDSEGACKQPRINNTTGPWHPWASMDPSYLSFHSYLHASSNPVFLPLNACSYLTMRDFLLCYCSCQCQDRMDRELSMVFLHKLFTV